MLERMLERIKEKVINFFGDEREEAARNDWNELLNEYSKDLEEKKKEYKKKEDEYWSMTEKELLKEIAVNTLRIRKYLELNG